MKLTIKKSCIVGGIHVKGEIFKKTGNLKENMYLSALLPLNEPEQYKKIH